MKKKTSAFVQAALELDETFDTLEEIAGSLSRLELNGESSYEKAKQLLTRFTERSQGLGDVLIALGQTLDERRTAVQDAVESVNERAPEVQQKLEDVERKIDRFRKLSAKVQDVTQSASRLGPAEVATRLRKLTEEAASLAEEAKAAKLRTLERNISSLRKSLKSIAHQLEKR